MERKEMREGWWGVGEGESKGGREMGMGEKEEGNDQDFSPEEGNTPQKCGGFVSSS